jgi:hypothetical protein
MQSNFFNIKSFGWQFLRDLRQYRTMLFGLYLTPLIFYFLLFVFALGGQFEVFPSINYQRNFYYFVLSLLILITSAAAFRDFRNDITAISYLTVPSSAFEKFLSMWVLILPFNFLAFTVLFYVETLFIGGVMSILGYEFHLIPLGQLLKYGFVDNLDSSLDLLFFHAILFAGAATFKKDAWLKTLLLFIAILIVLSVSNRSV